MAIVRNEVTFNRTKKSLERALKFLEQSRNPNGLWSDFSTLAGESVYWVSGYVGYAVKCSPISHRESWLNNVGTGILDHQNADGGWGYGPGVPSDADSTAWCLRFLSKLSPQNTQSRQNALSFLLKHQSQLDGGFRTYANPTDVGRYMMLDGSISFAGWASSQMCITAIAAQALLENETIQGLSKAIDYIRQGQDPKGYWNPYWWSGKLYATANCMQTLKTTKNKDDTNQLKLAQHWIASTQMTDGGWSDSPTQDESWPFSTALALKGLMIGPDPSLQQKTIDATTWLLDHQLVDGSWNSNYILHIPHPSTMDPWNQQIWKKDGKAINAEIKDHKRLFTTATAYLALSEFEEKYSCETK